MSNVFISYSRKNTDCVRRIKEFLEDLGHYVWIDINDIRLGDSLLRVLKEGIESVDYVLFAITKEFLESEWCTKHELEVAVNLVRNNAKIILVPIYLENITPKPDSISDIVSQDAYTEELFKVAMLRLKNEFGWPKFALNPKGFNSMTYVKEKLSFFVDDNTYTDSKGLLFSFSRKYRMHFALEYESRLKKMREGAIDEEIKCIDDARRYIYRKYYALHKDIEDGVVSLVFIRRYWGGSDIAVWASVVFPLQVALRRVLGEGAHAPFVLFFAIFYSGNESQFPQDFIDFYNSPEMQSIKDSLNATLRFRFLKPSSDEQSRAFEGLDQKLYSI
jgi:hypothetical protein